jgi:hypothetical protein
VKKQTLREAHLDLLRHVVEESRLGRSTFPLANRRLKMKRLAQLDLVIAVEESPNFGLGYRATELGQLAALGRVNL